VLNTLYILRVVKQAPRARFCLISPRGWDYVEIKSELLLISCVHFDQSLKYLFTHFLSHLLTFFAFDELGGISVAKCKSRTQFCSRLGGFTWIINQTHSHTRWCGDSRGNIVLLTRQLWAHRVDMDPITKYSSTKWLRASSIERLPEHLLPRKKEKRYLICTPSKSRPCMPILLLSVFNSVQL